MHFTRMIRNQPMFIIFYRRLTVLSGSGTELPTISPKSAGLVRIPHSSTQTNVNSSKDGKKSDIKTRDKKKNVLDGSMTFAQFKSECKLDEENLIYITEDTRMSTLQRKLARESNSVVAFGLALQISEVILYHENRGYVHRSSEIICDAIKEVFIGSKSNGSGSSVVNHSDHVKAESAKAMGRVAFVLYDGKASGKNISLINSEKSSKTIYYVVSHNNSFCFYFLI